ncbi:hypothetical protein EYR40_009137 [Pleurotus pulmonarius]|nr:hypothetical protein EYR40_009137 [Pleurotus pulmonarius]
MAATHHDPYRERSQESEYDLAPLRFPQLDASKQEVFTLPSIHQEFGEFLPPPPPPPSAPVSLPGVEFRRLEVPEI